MNGASGEGARASSAHGAGLDLAALPTEQADPRSADFDLMPLEAGIQRMLEFERDVQAAVGAVRAELARAVELAVARLQAGGRVFYVGAGTSGRLAALDAAELPPTFGSPSGLFQALIAGGPRALTGAVEGAEDDVEAPRRELAARGLSARDVVFGIAASGRTPYVHAALEAAREVGAGTIFFACVPREAVGDRADVSIRAVTGPEFLTGSTRLKAGSATKIVLNCYSTFVMARLGKVHGHWMVDLDSGANRKLAERAQRIFCAVTGAPKEQAAPALERAGGDLKCAILMQSRRVTLDEARARLERANGVLRAALAEGPGAAPRA